MAELKPQQASRVLIFESHGSKHYQTAFAHTETDPRANYRSFVERSLRVLYFSDSSGNSRKNKALSMYSNLLCLALRANLFEESGKFFYLIGIHRIKIAIL